MRDRPRCHAVVALDLLSRMPGPARRLSGVPSYLDIEIPTHGRRPYASTSRCAVGIARHTLAACTEPIDRFYSVIPAGGIGSRLWPLSRADAPKFLHDLTGSGHVAAARHLGPARAALRAATASWSSPAARTAPPSRSSCPSSPTRTSCSSPSRATRPPRSGWPPPSWHRREPDVIIGSFAADHVIRGTRGVRARGAAGGRGRARRIHRARSASRPPSRPSASATSRRAASSSSTARPRRALVESFVEKPDLDDGRASTSPTASYLWNAGMFIARADVLLERDRREPSPSCSPGSRSSPRPGTTRRRRGPAVDRIWPALTKIAIDYSVAEPAAAAGPPRRHPRPLRLGRRGRLRLARQAQLAVAARPTSRSSARTRGCCRTPPAASCQPDRPRHQPDRRAGHRRGRHPRRAAGDHERERAAGEGRRRRAQAAPAGATCSEGRCRALRCIGVSDCGFVTIRAHAVGPGIASARHTG